MNLLLIENDLYLAQKIASRLLDSGHSCVIAESSSAIPTNNDEKFDVVLLSSSMMELSCSNIIKRFEDSICIILASYISDETVTNPIKCGAKDYLIKPFIMDELLRKIYHHKEFAKISSELKIAKDYLDFIFKEIDTSSNQYYFDLPLLIETQSQLYADKIVFEFSNKFNLPVKFISLSKENWQRELQNSSNYLYYLTDYHTLKKNSKDLLLDLIADKKSIICSFESEDEFPYQKISYKQDSSPFVQDNIIPINDYVRLMVNTFQDKYPDTELSKRLGISRKSLWEKRKKLNIDKKK